MSHVVLERTDRPGPAHRRLVAMENALFADISADWPARCALIADAGFGGIYVVPKGDENLGRLSQLGREPERRGLRVAGCYANIDLAFPPAAPANQRVARIFQEITDAPRIELSFKCSRPEAMPRNVDDAIADRLVPLLAVAERRGLNVALYPHSFYLLETVAHAERLVNSIRHSRLSYLYATSHVYATSTFNSTVMQLRDCASRITSFNICGCRRLAPEPPAKCAHLPLDEGDLDLAPLFSALAADAYCGDVIVQGHGWAGDLPSMLHRCVTTGAKLLLPDSSSRSPGRNCPIFPIRS